MKRLLFYLALLIAVSPTMADNLYVEDVVVPSGGNISVPIQYQFDTEGLYGGYQFEITLPDGITAVLDGEGNPAFAAGDGFDDSFLAFSGLDPESGNSLFCGFSEAKNIQKTSGKLISITLSANNALENGTKLSGKITKAIFGNVDGETTVPVEDVTFHITIGELEAPEADTDISQMENVVYILPVEAVAGSQMELSIKMKNAVEAVGFGFDLILPEGITVPKKSGSNKPMVYLSTERTNSDNTGFIADYKLDGTLQVQAYDNGGIISGNDGEIAKVTINIAEEVIPGNYPIILKNAVVVPPTSLSIRQSYFKTTLTITDYIVGDANHDGWVDPGDLTAISHYLLERPDATFNEKAADANGDKAVDPGDLTAVSHLIMWGTIDRPNQLKVRTKGGARDPQ